MKNLIISRKYAKTQRKSTILKFATWQFCFLLFTFCFAVLSSCSDKNAYKKVDISNVKTNVKFLRLEQDLFSLNTKNFDSKQNELLEHYGDFYSFYLNEVMHFGKPRFERDTTVSAF